mmetsp:Transcript_28505/g.73384  ORF Transcript_28505/g.73384 Transcript_28505/m.73384 type:complete len:268 (-) Transcript_28505:897-1700(-)
MRRGGGGRRRLLGRAERRAGRSVSSGRGAGAARAGERGSRRASTACDQCVPRPGRLRVGRGVAQLSDGRRDTDRSGAAGFDEREWRAAGGGCAVGSAKDAPRRAAGAGGAALPGRVQGGCTRPVAHRRHEETRPHVALRLAGRGGAVSTAARPLRQSGGVAWLARPHSRRGQGRAGSSRGRRPSEQRASLRLAGVVGRVPAVVARRRRWRRRGADAPAARRRGARSPEARPPHLAKPLAPYPLPGLLPAESSHAPRRGAAAQPLGPF